MKAKIKNKEDGITLVALAVTIVVLLILAGITLGTVIGDNGIIARAQEAKSRTEQTKVNTEEIINELEQELSNNMNKVDSGDKENPDKAESIVDGVLIPSGFVYVGGTKESGLVISDEVADKEKYKGQETVGTDLQGNQFVWIPVEKIEDYKRTAFAYNLATTTIDSKTKSEQIIISSSDNNYFTETLPDDEKISVEKNKGYYIGRYETGDKESTDAKTLRASGSSISNTAVVKAGQAPYNYISYIEAKNLAEGFYKNKCVTSKLASSYAWDTAITFIQKTNSDYGNSSAEGNYKDTTFTYTDIIGARKTKANGTSTLIPTGQTTAVNNIYDMGGNVWEWTTESCSSINYSYTSFGGYCIDNFSIYSAGCRGNRNGKEDVSIGFRITLFI